MKKQKAIVAESASETVVASVLAEAVPTVGEFMMVDRVSVRPSATNPRKTFTEGPLAELAESIRTLGIQEPLIVRRLPTWKLAEPDLVSRSWRVLKDGAVFDSMAVNELGQPAMAEKIMRNLYEANSVHVYEIVAGERRWRAAGIAGLSKVPVIVKELSARQALEIQWVENLQREDLSPMEEAQGYRALIDSGDYTPETLAERLGIKRSTIYAKLKLTKLAPKVAEALQSGALPATVAELIGRLSLSLQTVALKKVLKGGAWVGAEQEAMSFRQAKAFLERDFTKDLTAARFQLDRDYSAVAEFSGPTCASCPNRSGNSVDWTDLSSPNVCTEPACFQRKSAVERQLKLDAFAAEGLEVMSEEQSKSIFQYGYLNSREYMRDTDVAIYSQDDNEKDQTFGALLGAKLPPAVVALNSEGEPVKLYRKAQVAAAIKEQGIKLPSRFTSGRTPEEEEQEELELRVSKASKDARICAAEEKGMMSCKERLSFLRLLVADYVGVDLDTSKFFENQDTDQKSAMELASTLCETQCIAALVEMLIESRLEDSETAVLEDLFPVDAKAVVKKVKAEMAEERRCPNNGEYFVWTENFRDRLLATRLPACREIKGFFKGTIEFHKREWVCTGEVRNEEALVRLYAEEVVEESQYEGQVVNYSPIATHLKGMRVMKDEEAYVFTGLGVSFGVALPEIAKKSGKKGGKAK